MKFYLVILLVAGVRAQYGPPPPPPGKWSGNRPSGYAKQPNSPNRQSPFGSLASVLPGGGASNRDAPVAYDDPIPQMPQDSNYDSQSLPARLPILAPNGVYEIYNRVVDDLIKRLEIDFAKKKMDPMDVVIRPTPAGPVRVPGYMQRRPFRRPGAALYRAGAPGGPPLPGSIPLKKKKKQGRAETVPETRFPEGGRPSVTAQVEESKDKDGKQTVRGAGKISKGPLANATEELVVETTPAGIVVEETSKQNETEVPSSESVETADAGSSEELMVGKSRSDEFSEDELDDETDDHKKTKKQESREDDDDEDGAGAKTNVETLMERYSNKNKGAKTKYAGTKTAKPHKESHGSAALDKSAASDEDDDDDDDDEPGRDGMNDDDDLEFDSEPGTPNGRPNGGYYPPGGPPAVPAKPNAVMSGLSKMRRTSDVAVTLDARSALITARLLVGPISVYINDSVEPKERGIKATIPELEAEMILMERHGVVFLQRFTLDRAYGQDVEVSIPKSKGSSSSSKKKVSKNNPQPRPGQPGYDAANSPAAQDRYQTKMAAHISMEVVKLLRSGNLRVNLMRTAQGSMTKLKLPIQKQKSKKTKKQKKEEALRNKSKESL